MDGNTKQITYNGVVLYDYNNKKLRGGYAFSDGGHNRDSGSLEKGSKDLQWFDTGGANTALATIASFSLNPFSLFKGKGSNNGKPTFDNKVNDGVDAVGFGVDATKKAVNKQTNIITVSLDTTHYHINTTESTVTGNTGQMPFTGTPESIQKSKDSLQQKREFYENWNE